MPWSHETHASCPPDRPPASPHPAPPPAHRHSRPTGRPAWSCQRPSSSRVLAGTDRQKTRNPSGSPPAIRLRYNQSPRCIQRRRDLQLFRRGKLHPLGLLPVAQGGVEQIKPLTHRMTHAFYLLKYPRGCCVCTANCNSGGRQPPCRDHNRPTSIKMPPALPHQTPATGVQLHRRPCPSSPQHPPRQRRLSSHPPREILRTALAPVRQQRSISAATVASIYGCRPIPPFHPPATPATAPRPSAPPNRPALASLMQRRQGARCVQVIGQRRDDRRAHGLGAGSMPATRPLHLRKVASACAAFSAVQSIGLAIMGLQEHKADHLARNALIQQIAHGKEIAQAIWTFSSPQPATSHCAARHGQTPHPGWAQQLCASSFS